MDKRDGHKTLYLVQVGRKVSDEFTVPLCRAHHQELHRHGNEKAWWANMQIAPLDTAKRLWAASQIPSKEDAAMPAITSQKATNEGLAT